jgi:hypothetical protein
MSAFFYFGKFEGMSAEQGFELDPQYVRNLVSTAETQPDLLEEDLLDDLSELIWRADHPQGISPKLVVCPEPGKYVASVELTAEQGQAADAIVDAAITSKAGGQLLALIGSAGTGKTTTLRTVLDNLGLAGVKVTLSATTRKAARVVEQVTGIKGNTVQSALGLKPKPNEMGELSLLKRHRDPVFERGSVLVIDESSMVNDELLKFVLSDAAVFDLTVVFVGDGCQLPPIGIDPKLFERPDIKVHRLSKIHRQGAQNPIVETATSVREFIEGRALDMPSVITKLNEQGEGIELVDNAEFERRCKETFKDGWHSEAKVVTYTNNRACSINNMIRAALYPHAAEVPFFEGETVVCNSAVMRGETVVLEGDTEFTVNSVKYDQLNHGVLCTSMVHKVGLELGVEASIKLFVANDPNQIQQALQPLRQKALKLNADVRKGLPSQAQRSAAWNEFFSAKESFADIRAPYAGTCHKTQGSSYFEVFVDLADMAKCRITAERARLIYTGLTRAGKKVIVNSGEIL